MNMSASKLFTSKTARDCYMKFSTKQELYTHTKKFCTQSGYGSITTLEQRLQEYKKTQVAEPKLSMADVKSYIAGEGPKIVDKKLYGDMTLEQLRGHFQSDPIAFQALQEKALRKGETELKEEIEGLKKEKREERLRRAQRDQQMSDLLKFLGRRKELEAKAVFEEGRVVSEMGKCKDKKGAATKLMELEILAEERKGLRLREQDLAKEIEDLQREISEQDTKLKKEKAEVKNAMVKESIRQREKEFEKELTQRVEALKRKKEKIEKEKEKAAKDFEAVKSGDLKSIKKGEVSRWLQETDPITLDTETKKKLMQDKARINKLREDLRKTKGEYLKDKDKLPLAADWDSHLPVMQDQGYSRVEPIRQKQPSEERKSVIKAGGLSQVPGYGLSPSITKKKPLKEEERKVKFVEKDGEEVEEEKPKKRRQTKEKKAVEHDIAPEPAPKVYVPPQIQPPAYSQHYPYPYPPPPPPWAFSMPPQQQSTSPLLYEHLKEIKGKLDEAVKQSEVLESEIQKYKTEPEPLLPSLPEPSKPLTPSQPLELPKSKFTVFTLLEPILSQNIIRNEDLEVEEKAMLNLVAQENDALKMLSCLNPNSEIYAYKLQQYKEMSAYRAELEKALQAQRIAKLRFDFGLQKKAVFQPAPPLKTPDKPPTAKPAPPLVETPKPVDYDKTQGFTFYMDYAIGMPEALSKIKLVYNIFSNGDYMFEPYPETDLVDSIRGVCLIRGSQAVAEVEPSPTALLVFEVHGFGYDQVNLGWTFLPVFGPNSSLLVGRYKLPIFVPETMPNITPELAKGLTRVPYAYLYVRIAADPNDEISATKPELSNQDLYIVPDFMKRPPTALPAQEPAVRTPIRYPSAKPVSVQPKENTAVNVKVAYLKSYPCSRPFRVTITLLEGNQVYVQPNTEKAVHVSQVYLPPPPTTTGGVNPLRKPLSAAGMQLMMKKSQAQQKEELEQRHKLSAMSAPNLPLNINCDFTGDFYQRKAFPGHPGFYLLFQVYEQSLRSATGIPIEDEFDVVSFSVFELFNEAIGQINAGEFTAQLYNAPVSVPVPVTSSLPGTITFVINGRAIMSPQSRLVSKPPGAIITPEVMDPPLHFANDAKFTPANFGSGEGFKFYIDSMRFIPETCGPLKVNLRGYYINLERFCTEVAMYPECSSKVAMPIYRNMRAQFLQNVNPTAIMVASLEMYDEFEQKDKILGFIAINIFVDAVTHKPVEDVNNRNYKLLEGCFQLPIYCEQPFTTPFNMQKITELDTVPCASVLVRIQKLTPGDDVKRYTEPPEYESGAYLTNYIHVSSEEIEWMNQKAREPSRVIRDVIDSWKLREGHNKEMDDNERIDWLNGFMKAGPRSEIYDPRLYARYDPMQGLAFCFDGLHNLATELHTVALCSFNPPGNYYKSPQTAENTFLCSNVDAYSPITAPKYAKEFVILKSLDPTFFKHLIIDLYGLAAEKDTPKLMNIGWTLLPLFHNAGSSVHVNSGIYQLPVFKPPVPTNLLQDFESYDEEVYDYLHSLTVKLPQIKYVEGMSVIARLKDNRYSVFFCPNTATVYRKPYEYKKFYKMYLPKPHIKKYEYNLETERRLETVPKVKMLVPPGMDLDEYNEGVIATAGKLLGIS